MKWPSIRCWKCPPPPTCTTSHLLHQIVMQIDLVKIPWNMQFRSSSETIRWNFFALSLALSKAEWKVNKQTLGFSMYFIHRTFRQLCSMQKHTHMLHNHQNWWRRCKSYLERCVQRYTPVTHVCVVAVAVAAVILYTIYEIIPSYFSCIERC